MRKGEGNVLEGVSENMIEGGKNWWDEGAALKESKRGGEVILLRIAPSTDCYHFCEVELLRKENEKASLESDSLLSIDYL